ncbi:MAG: restriction endonuclease subunit S [Euryarchaeota archaeon]|nr:restriction endonuclease subunit S [Euryarchaeota archaeon]
MTKDQYGSAIKHLEPHHIEGVPVPLLSDQEQKEVHDEILRAYELLDEANILLDKADELFHEELGLPRFDESLVPYLEPPQEPHPMCQRPGIPHPKAFTLKVSELNQRMDASYHVPVVRSAVALIRKLRYPPARLKQLVTDVVVSPRFKRIYVSKEYGVPFLQGSHLPEIRPHDLKYLSKNRQSGIERWIIHRGWVLVTCSGTIGRIGVVSSRREGWAASQHILRIVPDPAKGHPGYIAAFLMTPYGQHQLMAKTYGGVVDEISEDDMKELWIPEASKDIQATIGELVLNAFEMKDEACIIEDAAIRQVEEALQRSPKR